MTAATVTICGCGHAQRMHERDEAADSGRGNCMHGSCGCAEFRAADPVRVDLHTEHAEPAAPVVRLPAARSDGDIGGRTSTPNVTPPEPANVEYRCDDCGGTFGRPQALASHRRYKHSDEPAPDTRAKAARAAIPAGQPTCPDCGKAFGTHQGVEVHRGLAHKPDPDYERIAEEIEQNRQPVPPQPAQEPPAAPEPARAPQPEAASAPVDTAAAQPAPPVPFRPGRVVKDSRSITIELPAGWIEMNYLIDWQDATFEERAAIAEWTGILYRLGHVDYFAAVIGDPNSDEFRGDAS